LPIRSAEQSCAAMSQSQSSRIEHSGASHLLLELANLGAVNVVMFSRAVGIRGTDVCDHCHPRSGDNGSDAYRLHSADMGISAVLSVIRRVSRHMDMDRRLHRLYLNGVHHLSGRSHKNAWCWFGAIRVICRSRLGNMFSVGKEPSWLTNTLYRFSVLSV